MWANPFLENIEIDKSFFGKKHGKLAHLRIFSPKILHGLHHLLDLF